MGKASDRDSLVRLLAPVVEAQGLDLEDVVVTQAGKRRQLRVVVDQDGGISLDTVAAVSTAVALEGRLVEVDDDGIGVETDGVVTRLAWDRVASGRVQVEFNRPANTEGEV